MPARRVGGFDPGVVMGGQPFELPAGAIDFTRLPLGEAAAPLPGGMLLASGPASARTVQTGTSTVVVGAGITQHRGRIGRGDDAHQPALVVDEERTQRLPLARGEPTVAGLIMVGNADTWSLSGVPGPDGTGDQSRVVSANYSRHYTTGGQPTVRCAGSLWNRTPAVGPTSSQLVGGGNGPTIASGGNVGPVWTRRSVVSVASAFRFFEWADARNFVAQGGIAAGIRDVVVDLYQCEDGGFPTEVIQTGGATRQRESLAFQADAATYLAGGQLRIGVRLRPKGARSDYTGQLFLWWISPLNYATVSASSGLVTIIVNGTIRSLFTGMNWAAHDVLEVWTEAGGGLPTVVRWRVNGGARTTTTDAALGGIVVPALLDLVSASWVGTGAAMTDAGAERLVTATAGVGEHRVDHAPLISIPQYGIERLSFEIKNETHAAGWIRIGCGNNQGVYFDVRNGVQGSAAGTAYLAHRFTPLPGSWYRCEVWGFHTAANSERIYLTNADGATSWNAVGTEAVRVRATNSEPCLHVIGFPSGVFTSRVEQIHTRRPPAWAA